MSHRDSPRKQTLAVASMCCASGAGLESAVARRNGRFTIEAKDAEGQQLPHGGDTFTVTIHGASVVRARVHDREDGSYTCEYKTGSSGSVSPAGSTRLLACGADDVDGVGEVDGPSESTKPRNGQDRPRRG